MRHDWARHTRFALGTVAVALAGAALAACGTTDAPSAGAPPKVRLYAMHCGQIDVSDADAFADDGSMRGIAQSLIVPCYLVRHPSGDLIWDTGLAASIADLPNGLDPPGEPGGHFSMPKTITAQLAALGLTPAAIPFVSFSHMHGDHAGNGNMFAAARWIVDRDERQAMFSDAARQGEDFAGYRGMEHAATTLIEGDRPHDVFGDGIVVIHQAPGHTPGHTVLLVKTAGAGAVLLTGDLWHLAASRERRLVPRFNVDRALTLASMDAVEALAAATGARIIRQHVRADFDSLPVFPKPLE